MIPLDFHQLRHFSFLPKPVNDLRAYLTSSARRDLLEGAFLIANEYSLMECTIFLIFLKCELCFSKRSSLRVWDADSEKTKDGWLSSVGPLAI